MDWSSVTALYQLPCFPSRSSPAILKIIGISDKIGRLMRPDGILFVSLDRRFLLDNLSGFFHYGGRSRHALQSNFQYLIDPPDRAYIQVLFYVLRYFYQFALVFQWNQYGIYTATQGCEQFLLQTTD